MEYATNNIQYFQKALYKPIKCRLIRWREYENHENKIGTYPLEWEDSNSFSHAFIRNVDYSLCQRFRMENPLVILIRIQCIILKSLKLRATLRFRLVFFFMESKLKKTSFNSHFILYGSICIYIYLLLYSFVILGFINLEIWGLTIWLKCWRQNEDICDFQTQMLLYCVSK